jgi:methylated-DNA-[protein]-cysteine S-methyltransferase
MTAEGFALFETAIGSCGIAWADGRLIGTQLPETAGAGAARARMQRRFPGASDVSPPAYVTAAIEAIRALLSGDRDDLSGIELDMEAIPPFERSVYELARTIPPGKTLTYGDIAKTLGEPGSARAVGQALGRNPFAPVVPCHRVVAASGTMHGFSAGGGVATKLRMLRIEGWRENEPTLFDAI